MTKNLNRCSQSQRPLTKHKAIYTTPLLKIPVPYRLANPTSSSKNDTKNGPFPTAPDEPCSTHAKKKRGTGVGAEPPGNPQPTCCCSKVVGGTFLFCGQSKGESWV